MDTTGVPLNGRIYIDGEYVCCFRSVAFCELSLFNPDFIGVFYDVSEIE